LAFKKGNLCHCSRYLKSYAAAEFLLELPEIDEEIGVVTYIAAEGDISTIYSLLVMQGSSSFRP